MTKAFRQIGQKLFKVYLDLKIGWKLGIGFGLTLIAVFLIAGVDQFGINQMHNTVNSVIDTELEPIVYLNDIRASIAEFDMTIKDALLKQDPATLNYIRTDYLPNTVKRSVEYSFEQLLDKTTDPKQIDKLKQIQGYWVQYEQQYAKDLQNPLFLKNADLRQTENNLRFFLVGGINQIAGTDYRQQALVAKSNANDLFDSLQTNTLVLLGITILITLGVSGLTTWVILAPLTRMANVSRKIAQGELHISLPENRNDEFGEVARSLNQMAGELDALVREIKTAAEKVNEHNEKVMVGACGTTDIAHQLIGILSRVAEGADDQQKQVGSIHEVIRNVGEFSNNVNVFTVQVEKLSEDSLNTAVQGADSVRAVVDKMQRIQQSMNESHESMQHLGYLSNEIVTLVNMMREIADQTNLLALNASIEAARAGDYGRGFSVVAESIGVLAEQTKASTVKVKNLVSKIQATFIQLNGKIEIENQIVNEGERTVAGLETIFQNIITAVQQVNQEMGTVSQFTQKLTDENTEVLKAVQTITEIAAQHKEGTEQASQAAEQHFGYTQEINSASQILAGWGSNLKDAVDRFQTTNECQTRVKYKKSKVS